MLMQSPPPDLTIRQAFDFGSHLDQPSVARPPSHNTACNQSLAETLAIVAEKAEIRPVVFDREQALARLGGLEDLLKEVMQVMHTESPKVRARLDSAFARRDGTELKRAAHTLMGSASLAGARDLVARLRRVEELAVAGHFDTIAVELPEIDRQLNALQCRLDDELTALA